MAMKRMFSNAVVWTDDFLALDNETKLFYFYLGMQADECGFVDNAKMIGRILGIKNIDTCVNTLVDAEYIIQLKDGRLLLITDWNVNNNLDRRRTKSKYDAILGSLFVTSEKRYTTNREDGVQKAEEYLATQQSTTRPSDDNPGWVDKF